VLIGFSGASGSGKTTLVNALAEELTSQGYNVGIVREVVREIFKKWQDKYSSLKELRQSDDIVKFQTEALITQIRKELKAIREHEIVLVDRTIYDNLFYTLLWHNKNFEELSKYLNIIYRVSWLPMYDLIFFCIPLYHVDINDGFRTHDDATYRNIQHKGIRFFIPDRIPTFSIPAFDLNNEKEEVRMRVQYCLKILRKICLEG